MLNLFHKKLSAPANLEEYRELIESKRPFDKKQWTDNDLKQMKKSLKNQLEKIQEKRCAYCGLEYSATAHGDREHIAPKSLYPVFLFEPLNIVISCIRCNRQLKNVKDTICDFKSDYNECQFTIIHPFFDDPINFLESVNNNTGIILQGKNEIGANYIILFDLNSSDRAEARAKDIWYSEKFIADKQLSQLAEEISQYQPS